MPSSKGPKTWRSKAREEPKTNAPSSSADPDGIADALTMAAMQGNVEAVKALLEGGISADCHDAIGVAPLHWAAFCGHGEVTGLLLGARADVTVRDQEGRTPLHVAAYESHMDVIKRLLRAGAERLRVGLDPVVARGDEEGEHVAARGRRHDGPRQECAPRLTLPTHSLVFCAHTLSRLCSLQKTTVGWTPLHCAVSNGEETACKCLVDAGADPLRKDSEGKSAMDLAKHFGHTNIISILDAAQEQSELLALKELGIGSASHRGAPPSHRMPRRPSRSRENNNLVCIWCGMCLWCAPACVFVLVRAWVERVWMWFARLMCGGVGCDDDDVLH